MTNSIETPRHRLEVFYAESEPSEYGVRHVSHAERAAVRIILDELHRLHLALSTQAKTIAAYECIVSRYKKRNRKAPDARSQPPTARSTTPKTNKRSSPKLRRSEGE